MSASTNDNSTDASPWMTPAEVAKRWRVCHQTVLNKCATGDLKHFRIGRVVRIHTEAVVEAEKRAIPEQLKASDVLDNIPDEIGD